MISGVVANHVLRIRRSRRQSAVWTAISLGMGIACVVILWPGNAGAKILAIVGALLFLAAAVKLSRGLLAPRDLMLIGPEGIDQRVVQPHVLIPWREIADIKAIDRGHRVQTLGITVRDASKLPKRGQLNPIMKSRWLPRFAKLLLGATQVLYAGPSGVKDAMDTFHEDMDLHATLEISTLAFPMRTEELVRVLRSRWSTEVGRPPPPASAD
jgi:hypothetical protein